MKDLNLPVASRKRLVSIYRFLTELTDSHVRHTVTSRFIANRLGMTSAQVRKDLSLLGSFGNRTRGYTVSTLASNIAKLLGLNRSRNVALIGFGYLGHAIARYRGFSKWGYRITAIFDSDNTKVGTCIGNLACMSIDKLIPVIRRRKVELAMLAVPPNAAQNITDELVEAGIHGILNFVPVRLAVPNNVQVQSVDISLSMMHLTSMMAPFNPVNRIPGIRNEKKAKT